MGDPFLLTENGKKKGLKRKSKNQYDGFSYAYTRMPKSGVFVPEEMNDYKKIDETIKLEKGTLNTALTKGDNSIIFRYPGGNEKIVEAVIKESFEYLKKEVGLSQGRELSKSPIPKGVIIEFGTQKNSVELRYELIFQYEILRRYFDKMKALHMERTLSL